MGKNILFEICIRGNISVRRMQSSFSADISQTGNGVSMISVIVQDQAELYGLLNWLRDGGATLISVRQPGENEPTGGLV